jgi:hypothetical protein
MKRCIKPVMFCTAILLLGRMATDSAAATTSGPSIISSGSSSAGPISSTSLHGPGLEIVGGTELGAFLIATYGATAGPGDVTASFTVTPDPGAAFVYMLQGSGSRYSTRQLRLQRTPGSTQLQAAASTGNITCGPLPSTTATRVTLVFRSASRTFDVRINGAASACRNLPTALQPPITGFGMMDASNEGWGGRVDFTDLTVS